MPDYARRVATDYLGSRYLLGRTPDSYAIWEIATGGEAQQVFPLTNEGWAQAWVRFQELEGGAPVRPAAATEGAVRPLGLGGVLSGSFQVLGQQFGALALVVSVMIPFAILQVMILQALLGPELEALFSGVIARSELEVYGRIIEDQLPVFIAVGLGLGVISLFVTSFVNAALVRGGLQGFRGGRARAGELLSASTSKALSMAWIFFLIALILIAVAIPAAFVLPLFSAGGLEALLVVVAILIGVLLFLLYARYLFAPSALIAEGLRGSAALRRSWDLTRPRIWPIFGTFLLVLLMGAVANILISLPFQLIAQEQSSLGAFWVVASLGNALATVVVLPFTTVAVVHLYIDARARKEQLDPASLDPESAPSQP